MSRLMTIRSSVRLWVLPLVPALVLLPVRTTRAQVDRVAAIKQSMADDAKRLRQFEWIEMTVVSVKGEEKSRVQKQCSYGADGKVQKRQVSASPKPSAPTGLAGKIAASKKEELTSYMQNAAALVHYYVPPDPLRIQAAKDGGRLSLTPGTGSAALRIADYYKAGDSLTIDVDLANNQLQRVQVSTYLESRQDAITLQTVFAALDDGTGYPAKSVLTAPEKHVEVTVTNSGYRRLTPPAAPVPSRQAQAPIQDPGWPRERVVQGNRLTTYQPQVDEWKEFKDLNARMAFSLTPAGGKPVIGVVSFHARTAVHKDDHMVALTEIQITRTDFPGRPPEEAARLEALLKTFLPASYLISLDRLVACVPKPGPPPGVAVRNDPPVVFVSSTPAILLFVDGEPVRGKIQGSSIDFVVNTPWPLFFDATSSKHYLLVDKQWLTATALTGPWVASPKLPAGMSALAKDPEWSQLKAVVPPPPSPTAAAVPKVFYSTAPAEVILFEGKPVFARITGTSLLYATNTPSDVFMDSTTKQHYLLAAGRWFRAPALEGPWTYATADLPADFARIPHASPAGRVLASVPGTEEAKDAVLMAQIPTTLIVNPAAAAAQAKATYDGSPQFKPIDGTSMQYAVNTQDKVIKVGDVYYLCLQGIWFMSTTPQGPWTTAASIPQEIYTIPPSSPVYNVTYVTQTTTSSGNVEASHTAGYMGAFIVGVAVGAVVASSSGYYYPPYIYHPPYGYPVYRPYPVPYGGTAYYRTAGGAYGVTQTAYGYYGSATRSAAYNPYTGTSARSGSVSTPYGSRSAAQAYNPYTGTYAATRQGSSPNAQWGSSVVSTPYQSAYSQHYSDARGSVGSVQTSSGGSAVAGQSNVTGSSGFAAQSASGDMYAGKNGNMYKNTGSGWQTYDSGSGSWTSASSSAQASAQQRSQTAQQNTSSAQARTQSAQQQAEAAGVQQEAQNRQRGQAQSQRYQQTRSGGGASARRGGGAP